MFKIYFFFFFVVFSFFLLLFFMHILLLKGKYCFKLKTPCECGATVWSSSVGVENVSYFFFNYLLLFLLFDLELVFLLSLIFKISFSFYFLFSFFFLVISTYYVEILSTKLSWKW